MFKSCSNSQLLRRVLWISAEQTIGASLKHKNTQPLYMFNRVRVLHLNRLKERTWLHSFGTDKNTFFSDLDYKADIGQHFHKSEKSARGRHRHKIIKTNLKTLVSPLLMRSQGSQRCQKMAQDPLNMPVEVWCAKIAPKLKNIWKSLRKQGFFDMFFFNFDGFWSLCLLGAILAQKENNFICRKKNVIFWHPWDPWGRVNS